MGYKLNLDFAINYNYSFMYLTNVKIWNPKQLFIRIIANYLRYELIKL